MAKARRGDRVQVHFTGTLDDGSVFDSSRDGGAADYRNFRGSGIQFPPVELVIGDGEMFPSFEEAIVGLEPGQSVRIKIACADAFGPRIEERIGVVARSDITPEVEIREGWIMPNEKPLPRWSPQVGDVVQLPTGSGESMPALVTAVSDENVTLDANHPLAGKDLTFDITLVEIV